ncbi:flagellar hook-length control protein FliK [Aquibium sp. LZ166]|uniref:Flagellar hook-length control protein FliK n=1 Tax=Aquibium pacificus TaxID=3153579 RepID=A0ABV3SBR4_9HYPH
MDVEANAKADDARATGIDDEASPRVSEEQSELSPLQRLSKMFAIFAPRTDAKDAASDPETDGLEDDESGPGDHGEGKTDELEVPVDAAIALVAQASLPNQQPEPGLRLPGDTGKPAAAGVASALENAEDGESADEGPGEEARRDGSAKAASAVSVTDAITAAGDAAEAAEDGQGSGPSATAATVSGEGDPRVRVVSDTPNIAPAPQNLRTVAGLAAAIAGDGEWRSAIEQINTLEADVSRSQQAPIRDLKIQLNPANLGEVNARLRLTGEQLSVEIRVDSPEAYHRLSGERDAIVSSLRGLGFRVEDVSIQQQSQGTGNQPQSGSGGRSGDASASLSQGSGKDQGQSGSNQNRSNTIPQESDANLSRTRPSADGIYI